MKKFVLGTAAIITLGAAYLSLWPVSIDPASWDAPVEAGYVGDYAPNTRLADLELLPIGDTYGPEDVAYRETEGGFRIYVSGHKGEIIEVNPGTKTHKVIANTGGIPLGIEFGIPDSKGDATLYIADAYKGLLSLSPGGTLTLLTNEVDGTPIAYADDLDIGPDGVIYFSDASTKFGAQANGGALAASLLEVMEHRKTGRVLSYDPRDGVTRVVADGFSFSNGVAMAADGQSIFVNETGTYSLHRLYVDGPRKGEREVVLSNLPGFPDNINDLPDGTFILGLVSKRATFLDDNSGNPFLRKLAMRLPAALRPQAESYGLLAHLSKEGDVLSTWQDPSGAYPMATGGIIAPDGFLYVSSLTAPALARLKLN